MLKSTLLYIKQRLKAHSKAFSPVIIIEDHIYRLLFTHSHDEKELYQHFPEYEKDIQSSIYKVAESRLDNIIADTHIVLDDSLLSALLIKSRCSTDDKIQLWAKAIPNLTEETCKKHFDEMGFPELKGIFTKRNNYTKTYESNGHTRDILEELKKNTWIFDYYLNSVRDGYIVVKNPIKDKKH